MGGKSATRHARCPDPSVFLSRPAPLRLEGERWPGGDRHLLAIPGMTFLTRAGTDKPPHQLHPPTTRTSFLPLQPTQKS